MTDAHVADLATACYLAIDIAEDQEIKRLAQRGLDMLLAKSDDYAEIKYAIGTVIQWLSTQSNSKIYNATIKRLKVFDEQAKLS